MTCCASLSFVRHLHLHLHHQLFFFFSYLKVCVEAAFVKGRRSITRGGLEERRDDVLVCVIVKVVVDKLQVLGAS